MLLLNNLGYYFLISFEVMYSHNLGVIKKKPNKQYIAHLSPSTYHRIIRSVKRSGTKITFLREV